MALVTKSYYQNSDFWPSDDEIESGYVVESVFDGSKVGIEPHSVEVLPSGELLVLDSANRNLYKISSPLPQYFLMYSAAALAVVLALVLYCELCYGQTNIMVYVGICSVIGSLTVMSVKAIGIAR